MKIRIYEVMKLLGGTSELLSIIGGWDDTLSEEEIKEQLDIWILSQKQSPWTNWNWNKQMIYILLNPQDKKAEEWQISLKETPVLFNQLLKMTKNFFPPPPRKEMYEPKAERGQK